MPVIRVGGCLRVPRWTLLELAMAGRVVRLCDAAELGLAKDTVARALGRLRRAGLVTACQTRSTAGIFATGSYRLTIPDTLTISTHTTRSSSSRARACRRVDAQLALAIDV
jgi:hypothetical protein